MNAPETLPPPPTRVVLSLPLARIVVPPDRLREVDKDRAKAISVSMGERGQITPIEVQPADAHGRYVLNTGAHRFMAAKMAKLPTIDAMIFIGDADERRLREIDENLYRAELTPFDQAAFLAERLDIFQRQHGAPGKGRPKKSGASSHRFLFYTEVKGRFGLSADVVKKAMARFEGFSAEERAQLRLVSSRLSGADLDKLKSLAERERAHVLQRLLPTGNAVLSLADVLREIGGAKSVTTPLSRAKAAYLALVGEERGAFDKWHAGQISGRV